MKASELIERLAELKAKHGDLNVLYEFLGDSSPALDVELINHSDEKENEIIIS